jgi:enamine deaminase RidA (YjgF/YER057c/UK114 family)
MTRISSFESFILYFTRIGKHEEHVTAAVLDETVQPGAVTEKLYRKILQELKTHGLSIVHERVFGSLDAHEEVRAARDRVFTEYGLDAGAPWTYIEGQPLWGRGLAGVQIRAVMSETGGIWTVYDREAPVGKGWNSHGASFIMLQNIHGLGNGASPDQSREDQAGRMLERVQDILHQQKISFRNVVRTWIYLSKILDWYGPFNTVRTGKFQKFGLLADPAREKNIAETIYMPASTGIEGNNPMHAASAMDVLAVRIENGSHVTAKPASGVKQKSAFRYGSAFSRAMVLDYPDAVQILVSGTAAIDDRGKSLFEGDAEAQIRKTFEVVEALVKSEGGTLKNITEATAFVKRPADAAVYRKIVEELGLSHMPAVTVVADVCRDELLFELDAVAAFGKKHE